MIRCLRALLVVSPLLLLQISIPAQTPNNTRRVHGPVDENSLVALPGSVPGPARAEFDLGEAPPSARLSHVRLVLSRSRQQQAALDRYDAELLDKSSPQYHKWLTPEQFGQLYGPSDSDVAAIVAWIASHGLQVDPVDPGRTDISFSGSVAQIEDLLHTSIHSFNIKGEQFYSNVKNPKIPAALSGAISGVARLNTLQPRPQHIRAQMGSYDRGTGILKPVSQGDQRGPRANLTSGSGTSSSPYTLFLTPGDASTIYDTPNTVLNANFTTGTSYTGKGVTIGIGGDAVINSGTVLSYRQRFISPTDNNAPIITNVDNTTATGDTDEAYLDVELAGALAPAATIHFYTGSTIDVAVEKMLTDNSVDIFNLSFGSCELALTTGDNQLINGWWQQAASQGIAVTVSTGDDGSAACDDNNTQTAAESGLMVSGFASTPWNIAVGGTDFGALLTGFTTYADTTDKNSATTLYRTARSYIPEWTWNDSTTGNTTISANVPFLDSQSNANIVAASGGASNCSVNSDTSTDVGACLSGYPKPSWQRGSGVPSDGARDLPDISLMAGAGGDNAAWLVCTDESGSNGSNVTVTADCTNQSDGHFYFFGFGGTSTSAPAFAGILALVQESAGSRLGQAAQGLYDLYNDSQHNAEIFHDITSGNISVPCDNGTPNCQNNTAGHSFLTGYDATAGYDLATGMGSVDVANLIKYWGSSTLTSSTVNIASVTPASATTSDAVTVTGTVSGGAGTPTGSVVVISDGGYSSTAQTLTTQNVTTASFSVTIPAGSLKVGSDTITVNYGGDTNYQPASDSSSITVNGATPTITVTPSATSIKASNTLTVSGSVSGSSVMPTGTVSISGAGYAAVSRALVNGSYSFSIAPGSLSAGDNQPITVSYSGDTQYAPGANSTSISVAADYTLTAATPAAISAGGSTSSTITVSSTSGYAGTVTLTCALSSSPSGAVHLPQCSPTGTAALSSTAKSATTTVSITTTAATAKLEPLHIRGGWAGAGSGVALAALLLFGIPARRRKWMSMFYLLVLAAAVGGFVGCGGGGGSSSGGGGGSPGTTAGSYTFTVSATGSDSAKISASTTFTLTVN